MGHSELEQDLGQERWSNLMVEVWLESPSDGYSRSYEDGSFLGNLSVLKEAIIIDQRYGKQGPGPSKKGLVRARQGLGA